jgi:hypothetical protein
MSVTVYRNKKARVGSENGNARLSDADVRIIRMMVFAEVRRRIVADLFGLSQRHVNNIALGKRRPDAEGRVLKTEPEKPDLSYDESRVIRCRNCRQKVYASRTDRERCVVCASRTGTRNAIAA